MTETLWLAGILIANLWATGSLDANATEKDALGGAAAGRNPDAIRVLTLNPALANATEETPIHLSGQPSVGDKADSSDVYFEDLLEKMYGLGILSRIPFVGRLFREVVYEAERTPTLGSQEPASPFTIKDDGMPNVFTDLNEVPRRTTYETPILSQIPYLGRRLFTAVGYEAQRTPILPALKHGENATCEQPPTQQEILAALPTLARGVPYVYEQYRDEIEFTVEKLVDRVDGPRFFPLIGMAQLHHCHWKCTVYYTDVIEIANPFPFTTRTKHEDVVYIDRDHLHLCGEQNGGAETSEPPQSCPGGHFRPTPKSVVKAEPVQQVMLEITVASVDRAAVPDATYRWAKKQLGLSGDNVGFGVPKNQDAASELVQAFQKDGFVKVMAMPRVTTLSGQKAHLSSVDSIVDSRKGGMAFDIQSVVNADHEIELEISPQIVSVVDALVHDIQTARLRFVLADGQTAVIGGLTQTETTETDDGVPILNELPYVGALFASKRRQQTERDLLILVRAHLVAPGDAEETSEPPLSNPFQQLALTPFPTVPSSEPVETPDVMPQTLLRDDSRNIYVIVDGGADGRQVTAIHFEGQSVLDLIADTDSVKADNVNKLWVTRPAPDGNGDETILPIDWKVLTQSGRCGVELMAGDRINIALEPVKMPCAAPSQTMSSADIVKMSQAGVSAKIILRQMELTNAVFNLTADDIISLHEQGVSKRIIRAMQERRPTEEKLISPPELSKYSTTGYPDQAFDKGADPQEAKHGSTAITAVVASWDAQMKLAATDKDDGLPGLTGRVFLRSPESMLSVEADGCLHVEMYDVTASTPVKLAEWRFDAESLKKMKRTDLAVSYTLFLPWEGYCPEITQVEMRVVYMPENVGEPQHAEPQVLRLKTSARATVPMLDFGFPIIPAAGDRQQIFSFWSGLFR